MVVLSVRHEQWEECYVYVTSSLRVMLSVRHESDMISVQCTTYVCYWLPSTKGSVKCTLRVIRQLCLVDTASISKGVLSISYEVAMPLAC